MKKSILIIIAILSFNFIYSQDNPKPSDYLKKHEISIDIFESLLDKYEISYDYILNDNASIGSTISYSSNSTRYLNNSFKQQYAIDINYKIYFSKKRAQGFYVELFSELAGGNQYYSTGYDIDFNKSKPYTNLYAGFNLGYKYVNKNNYFINTSVGFSKRIVSFTNENNNYYSHPYKPNFTLSIGKRF